MQELFYNKIRLFLTFWNKAKSIIIYYSNNNFTKEIKAMKKIILIFIAIILCGCAKGDEPKEEAALPEVGAYGEALPITRGEVSRMIALCMYDIGEIISSDEKAEFSDISPDDDLYKYINAVCLAGVMLGGDGKFRPNDYLTVREASFLIDAIDKSGRLSIETDEKILTSPISYYKWIEIMDKLSQAGSLAEIKTASMTILLTEYKNSEIENYIITDSGLYRTDGFISGGLENCGCEFMVKDNCIIGIKSIATVEPTLQKCLVLKSGREKTEIYAGGVKKELTGAIACSLECPYIADIQIKGEAIESSSPYTQEKSGKIIMADDVLLFDDDYSYNIGEGFTAYQTFDGISCGSIRKIISGSNARVFFKDNKAVCAICDEVPKDKIRVVMTSPDGELINKSITLSSDKEINIKSGESEQIKAGSAEINTSTDGGFFRGKKLTATSDGDITVNGNACGGHIDIIKAKEGYYVVSELGIDEYLYGVVCGEMPASYGVEALKAQALAARSYAYNQLFSNKRLECGGNIDNTVAFQVYNPGSVCPEATEAVDKTKGEYIVYDDNVINANFYSTSCGIGANSGEIWSDGGLYPSSTPEYLSSGVIGDFERPDFSDEAKALSFFKLKNDKAYEKDFPYFRWSFSMPLDGFKSTVGSIISATVTKRGEGGNVMSMTLEGEDGDLELIGENAVRNSVKSITVKLSDGTTREMTSLPSTFFAIEKNGDMLYFYGGGFGHGVGMSQNGAKALADMGMNYKDIIKSFFKGCEVEKIA